MSQINELTIPTENKFAEKTQQAHDLIKQITYEKKHAALEAQLESPNLHLFGYDLNITSGAKHFFISTYNHVYYASLSKTQSLYEYYEDNDQIKLMVDIDINLDGKEENPTQLFTSIITTAIRTVNNHLKNYTNVTPTIILLSANRKDKMSCHIIYQNIYFKSIVHMKYFMCQIDNQLIKNKIIDPNIYRRGCFRMLWNSKIGKNNPLEYFEQPDGIFIGEKYNYTTDKQLFLDSLLLNINKNATLIDIVIPKKIKLKADVVQNPGEQIIESGDMTKKYISIKDIINSKANKIHTCKEIKQYVDLLSIKRARGYDEWVTVGMCIYNCLPNKEGFQLWNEFSKQADNYDGEKFLMMKWNSFSFGTLGIATLKKWAKEDNQEAYNKLNPVVPINILFKSLEFSQEYLMDRGEIIKDKKSILCQNIDNWMTNSDVKFLCIKSPYGTGKTCTIKSIISEYEPKRILFVSYRQSLSREFLGSFRQFGFQSYFDSNYGADRFICQIESLSKIINSQEPFQEKPPKFDLVILDEIESILNHFKSTTIKDKHGVFEYLHGLVGNATKVLALDGDFGNRSFVFVNSYSKTIRKVHGKDNIILENTIKKNIYNYTFMNKYDYFDKQIEDDLKAGKNICLISMSSNEGLSFYDKYKTKYKSIFYCSKTDDDVKADLEKVEEIWINHQFVIYSPTIVAGVSFDLPHFYKKYVLLTNMSCTPRDLTQMIARIRQTENHDILVYMNNIPYRECANFFTYEGTREYMYEMIDKYFKREMIENEETGEYEFRYNVTLQTKIEIHNEQENLNKSKNYFIASLIQLLQNKHCEYKYQKVDDCVVKEIGHDKNKENLTCKKILQAVDINEEEYETCMENIKASRGDDDQKYEIEKYELKKNWKVKKITKEFLDKFYGKNNVLNNCGHLMGKLNNDVSNKKEISSNDSSKYYVIMDNMMLKEQIDIIRDLVKVLGFDLKKININWSNGTIKASEVVNMLNMEIMEQNVEMCKKNSILFKNYPKIQKLFQIEDLTTVNKEKEKIKAYRKFVAETKPKKEKPKKEPKKPKKEPKKPKKIPKPKRELTEEEKTIKENVKKEDVILKNRADNIKRTLSYLNSVLRTFGIKIMMYRKTHKTKIGSESLLRHKRFYYLSYWQKIDKHL